MIVHTIFYGLIRAHAESGLVDGKAMSLSCSLVKIVLHVKLSRRVEMKLPCYI